MDRLSAVGVVTWPLARSGAVPLGNLIHIITSIADDTYLISGGEGAMGFLKEPGVEVILIERRTFAVLLAESWDISPHRSKLH